MTQRDIYVWSRSGQRRDVDFGAFAERADGSETALTISNLSYDGCQLRSEEDFKIGERLKLNFPRRGRILAEIRWTAERRAGAIFIVDEATVEL